MLWIQALILSFVWNSIESCTSLIILSQTTSLRLSKVKVFHFGKKKIIIIKPFWKKTRLDWETRWQCYGPSFLQGNQDICSLPFKNILTIIREASSVYVLLALAIIHSPIDVSINRHLWPIPLVLLVLLITATKRLGSYSGHIYGLSHLPCQPNCLTWTACLACAYY